MPEAGHALCSVVCAWLQPLRGGVQAVAYSASLAATSSAVPGWYRCRHSGCSHVQAVGNQGVRIFGGAGALDLLS